VYNLKYLQVTISYILFISILSHISSDGLPESPNSFSNQDKIFHLIEFFILGILIQLSLLERKFKAKNEIMFLTIIFGFSIACIDELHQSFVPGRHCSINDLYFDFFGIILSFINYKKFY
tara:strand:- start:215 stop:574 length:360 start_codon:yes stop_codon:yes gene_type:complete